VSILHAHERPHKPPTGGEGRIRTPDAMYDSGMTAFEVAAFVHSATSPACDGSSFASVSHVIPNPRDHSPVRTSGGKSISQSITVESRALYKRKIGVRGLQ
jgi:hypothetical protein